MSEFRTNDAAPSVTFSMARVCLIALLSLVCACAHSRALPAAARDTLRNMPFELTQSRIYVDAFVNGQGPFRFMVDTGADGVGRVDVRVVEQLGLQVVGSAMNSDNVNAASVQVVRVDELRIGGLVRRAVEVLSRDYNTRLAAGAKPLMGIIGREFFTDPAVTFDYVRAALSVSAEHLRPDSPDVVSYEQPFELPLKIGQHDGVGHLDTGSTLDMHFPLAWATKLGIRDALQPAGEGRRANTVFQLFSAKLPVPVVLAANRVDDVDARFSESATRIHIGGRFLHRNNCVVTIDQQRKLVRVRCGRGDNAGPLNE
ncbi:MAG TPA: aspartyl protease family protein [Thermoanaerobaculia bacterium]|jgi:predicted aspartyl protease